MDAFYFKRKDDAKMKKEDFVALGLDEGTAKKYAKESNDELATYLSKA